MSAFDIQLGVLVLVAAGVVLLFARLWRRKLRWIPLREAGTCELCEHATAINWCQTHRLGVCVNCTLRHDDGATCSYIPTARLRKSVVARGARA